MSHVYNVDVNNTVTVTAEGQSVPFLSQPHYPNGDAWEDAAAAATWAELFIASIEDADAPYAPIGQGLPGEPKPTAEQIAEWEAAQEQARADALAAAEANRPE